MIIGELKSKVDKICDKKVGRARPRVPANI